MHVLKFTVDTTYRGSWKEYPYEEVVEVKDNIALCNAETSKMYLEYRGFKTIGQIDNETQLEKFLRDLIRPNPSVQEPPREPISYKDMLQPLPNEFEAGGPKIDVGETPPSDLPKWWKG